jgi:hypothetical protein
MGVEVRDFAQVIDRASHFADMQFASARKR